MGLLEIITGLSHEFGTVDYVRGGGGNTSAKDGDTLWVGPRDKLTPGLAARIRRHKAEVVEARRRRAEAPCDTQLGWGPFRHERFAAIQSALRRRGFHVLADRPEVVLALLAVAEEFAVKLGERAGNE